VATEPIPPPARDLASIREANEHIRQLIEGGGGQQRLVGLICECSRTGCMAPIVMSVEEYDAVRADPKHCFVSVGHVWDDRGEHAVVRTGTYWVVTR
jgi:hypothetical protein